MAYEILKNPLQGDLSELDKEQLVTLYNQFIQQIPVRIASLSQFISSSLGYENWTPDYSAKSLDVLGKWYSEHVEMRLKTEEEMEIAKGMIDRKKFPYGLEPENATLTSMTISLATDVAVYFAESLKNNHSDCLFWKQNLATKRDADYGRAILVGKKDASLEPTRIMFVLARQLSTGKETYERFSGLYKIWESKLTSNGEG